MQVEISRMKLCSVSKSVLEKIDASLVSNTKAIFKQYAEIIGLPYSDRFHDIASTTLTPDNAESTFNTYQKAFQEDIVIAMSTLIKKRKHAQRLHWVASMHFTFDGPYILEDKDLDLFMEFEK